MVRRGSRWLWWQTLGSVAALLCATAPALAQDETTPAAPHPLSYQPVALAWSAAEVERASARQLEPLIDEARSHGDGSCGALCRRLHGIFDRLLPLARAQSPQAARLNWSLAVVRSRAVDAFSLPGGQVVVSEAFAAAGGRSDEELAFVLAHEMAHCVLEHERQALTFARLLLPRDVPRSVADMYTEIDHNFSLLKAMEVVMQAGEFEADELGLLLASGAGYAPRQQLAFIDRETARGEGRAPLVRSHPPASQRAAQLQARLPLAERLFDAALERAAGVAAALAAGRAGP